MSACVARNDDKLRTRFSGGVVWIRSLRIARSILVLSKVTTGNWDTLHFF